MARSARWTAYTLVGLAVWLGATVIVAATNADPSDATPILRTFAVGGAGFVGLALLGAGAEIRHARAGATERLYQRLALTAVPPAVIRAAARRTAGATTTYLVLTGLTSGLLFTAIGLGESGPFRELLAAMLVLVLIWFGYSLVARGRADAGTDELLAPLGLAVAGTPAYLTHPVGGGRLVGELRFTGRRHGRAVSVRQATGAAVTEIAGVFEERTMTSPTTLASFTGEPVRCWRDVAARAGGTGVVVRRAGNGAGRWFLFDLLLAERLAALTGTGR